MNVHDWISDYVADQWEEALDDVTNLMDYHQDWDGEGALPVRSGLIEATIQFLDSARLFMSAPQDVYLSPDGTVLIEWHSAEGHATIANIRETNRVEIVYRRPGHQPHFAVELIMPASDGLPGPAHGPNGPVSCLDDGAFELAA